MNSANIARPETNNSCLIGCPKRRFARCDWAGISLRVDRTIAQPQLVMRSLLPKRQAQQPERRNHLKFTMTNELTMLPTTDQFHQLAALYSLRPVPGNKVHWYFSNKRWLSVLGVFSLDFRFGLYLRSSNWWVHQFAYSTIKLSLLVPKTLEDLRGVSWKWETGNPKIPWHHNVATVYF